MAIDSFEKELGNRLSVCNCASVVRYRHQVEGPPLIGPCELAQIRKCE